MRAVMGKDMLRVVGLAAVAAACGPQARPSDMAECTGIDAGELVVTEVMANPPGQDGSREWFEIYNRTDESVPLDGLAFEIGAIGGPSKSLRPPSSAPAVPPGGFVTFGLADDDEIPPYVDLAIGSGSLRNQDGLLQVRCGETLVDEVRYASAGNGASLSFSSDQVPDAARNDDPAAWCPSTTRLEGGVEGELGTPGRPNDVSCASAATDSVCADGGRVRPVSGVAAGDVIISEIQANPQAVADDVGEWIELTVLRDVDLNGLRLSRADGEIGDRLLEGQGCVTATVGTRLIVARSVDPIENGGLPSVAFELPFSLTNGGGELRLVYLEQTVDHVRWEDAPAGRALSLDPGAHDEAANDDDSRWCPASTTYGTGEDLGSPGAANPACPDASRCALSEGGTRARVPPLPGFIRIDEVMPNPAGPDASAEWVELFVTEPFDLNGLAIGRGDDAATVFVSDLACVPAEAGDRFLLASSLSPTENGGLPPPDFVLRPTLVNADGRLRLEYQGEIIDVFAWTDSTSGRSIQRDADDPDKSCAGFVGYGDQENFGTPGAPNLPCREVAGGDSCFDGQMLRPIQPPAAGDVWISEWMPNPVGRDTDGEWLELTANVNVDLNGVSLVRDEDNIQTLTSSRCLALPAGTQFVLVRNVNPAENGGIDANGRLELSMVNRDGGLQLRLGEALLDEVSWASSEEGLPFTRDASGQVCTPSDGSMGTPGAANPPCP